MKRFVSFVLLALAAPAFAEVQFQTDGDLWAIARGASVTANSSVVASVPEALLSRTTSGAETGTLFFADGSDGTVDFIEFQTAKAVTVGGFNLWANGDGPNFPERRAIRHFKLKAKVGQNFQTVYDEDVPVPYEDIDDEAFLIVSTTIDPVTASEFRAEFTQNGSGPTTGPRIQELDGFPPKLCGDADYSKAVTAPDALAALRRAVGSGNCPVCVCDVNVANEVTATDAQTILRYSVGQSVDLHCIPCVFGEP